MSIDAKKATAVDFYCGGKEWNQCCCCQDCDTAPWVPECERPTLKVAGQDVVLKARCQSVLWKVIHSHFPIELRLVAVLGLFLKRLIQFVCQKVKVCVKMVWYFIFSIWYSKGFLEKSLHFKLVFDCPRLDDDDMHLFFHLYTFLLKMYWTFIGNFAEVYRHLSYGSLRPNIYKPPFVPKSV